MDNYPLISIIIPCFNAERFIGAAIDSALNQTWPNTEVIVVDDGSIDRSPEIIKAYGNRLITHTQKNCGVSSARNAGLSFASGEYVNFLDSDDLLAPEKLEKCFENFNYTIDAVFCEYEKFYENNVPFRERVKSLFKRKNGEWSEDDAKCAILKYKIHMNTVLFRKSIIKSIEGFNTKLSNQEDVELLFRLANKGIKFKKFEGTYVHEREHNDARRLTKRSGQAINAYNAQLVIHNLLKEEEVTPELKQAMADRYAMLGRVLYQEGNRETGEVAINKAYRLSSQPNPTANWPLYNMIAHIAGIKFIEKCMFICRNYLFYFKSRQL